MPLPASVRLVPCTGTYTYRNPTGTHPGGARVVFVSLSRDIAADAEVTLPAKLVATLTAAGKIPDGFVLPTLVDAAREIEGVYYQVKEDFPGGRAPFEIFVASDATSVDMSTVAPVVPVDELEDTRGPKGDKGDTGDVTPEAEAARDAAATSAQAASDSADAAAASAAKVRAPSSEIPGTTGTVLDVQASDVPTDNCGIVIGPSSYDAATIGSGSLLIGGYTSGNVNRLPGTQNLRAIVGGYDNEIEEGALAGAIFGSHHSLIAAAASHAAIFGGSTHKILAGNYASIGGGQNNTIEGIGTGAVVGGGIGNTASGSGSVVVGGNGNLASGNASLVNSGNDNVASGTRSAVMSGDDNEASAESAVVLNGQQNVAAAAYSTVRGFQGRSRFHGQHVYSGGCFTTPGDSQGWDSTMRATTTDGTSRAFTLNGSQQLGVEDESAVGFSIMIIGRCAATGEAAAYKLEGCIKRGDGAGTTALVGSVVKTVLGENSAGWDVNASANTSSGRLSLTATGESGKTINWTASIRGVDIVG